LLKETTEAFDGTQIHDLHITNQTCNPLRHPYLGEISVLGHFNEIASCSIIGQLSHLGEILVPMTL